MNPNNLIFIDETGSNLNMTLPYARGVGGERVKVAAPVNRGTQISIIGAISPTHVEAALYGEWATNGETFYLFLEKQLVPTLHSGHIVIMDNVRFHKSDRIRKLIEETGATLEFLPEYSPDFNPIESMWSKIKNIIRQYEPRTLSEFKKVIKIAFESVTENDLRAWYKHCGYATD